MKLVKLACVSLSALALVSCKSAQEHRQDVSSGPSTFSLGQVQSSVRQGMEQGQVVSVLGSPNIVTTSADGTETWVYDKIASEGAHSASGYGGSIILFGGEKRAGAYETTQKTLTVMIKFNSRRQVESINYHQSKF